MISLDGALEGLDLVEVVLKVDSLEALAVGVADGEAHLDVKARSSSRAP